MHESLMFVSERFPAVRDRMIGLFERDESFRELCEEYQACARTLARLESEAAPGSEDLQREYHALLLRLEREMLDELRARPGGAGP